MEFSVLGPVTAWRGAEEATLGGPRQRCILGVLLLEAGHEVTVTRLAGYLWGEDPPPSARSIIQVQVSHLRRAVPDVIVTTAAGYRADVPGAQVDVHRFRALASRAASAADPHQAAAAWEQALACWRGEPLSGVGSPRLRDELVQPLAEERLTAIAHWAECALEIGRHGDVATGLGPVSRANPLRERLRYLRILALYRGGDRTGALTEIQALRTELAAELGVDPRPEVAELHQRMLREDGEADVASPAPVDARSFITPNQLPRDIADFTGRDAALTELQGLAGGAGDAPTVCVVSGPGGAGKTATVIRAAHRLSDAYPDGQLFVDLRGFTDGAAPLDSGSALAMLLRSVGIPPDAIPPTAAERAALWRGTVSGRRQLLVLDNAAGAAQVEALLPGTPGCLTLVTSRNDLAELQGTRRVTLGRLDGAESLRLLSAILGEARVSAEPTAARRVARYCAGLPLALRIVAARMATRPRWTFDHLEGRLRHEPRRLKELRSVDHNITTVFDLSVHSLDHTRAEAFTALGTMLGGDITLHALAALLDIDPLAADDLVQDLVSAHLVEEAGPDHYRLHDLTRAYARQRAREHWPEEARREHADRLAEYYLRAAAEASQWLGPRSHDHPLPVGKHSPPEFGDHAEVLPWFDTHREALAEALEHFAATGSAGHAWQLAQALWRSYAHQGETRLWLRTHQSALAAAQSQQDAVGVAVTLTGLGIAHCYQGQFATAEHWLQRAHRHFAELGDAAGQARAVGNLAMAHERMGEFGAAVSGFTQVLRHAREGGDAELERRALANLAVTHLQLGELDVARDHCAAVLADGGDSVSHAQALRALGEIYRRTGELMLAEGQCMRALGMFTRWGDDLGRIETYLSLALVRRQAGDTEAALACHAQSLDLGAGGQSGREAELRVELGLTHARAGAREEARESLRLGLELARERGERFVCGRALLGLGRLGGAGASQALAEAAEVLGALGVPEAAEAGEAARPAGGE